MAGLQEPADVWSLVQVPPKLETLELFSLEAGRQPPVAVALYVSLSEVVLLVWVAGWTCKRGIALLLQVVKSVCAEERARL